MIVRRTIGSIGAAALLATACARHAPPALHARLAAGGITAHAVKTGLNFPAAFTFAPSGRIFFGEKTTGNIRTLDPKTGHTRLFFRVPAVNGSGEQGLLGIALHPRFPASL